MEIPQGERAADARQMGWMFTNITARRARRIVVNIVARIVIRDVGAWLFEWLTG